MSQDRAKKTRHIAIAIEPEFRRHIEQQAERENRTMSCFIRSVLAERLSLGGEARA